MLRPRTVAAIGAAREAGIHVLLVTGRMFRSVRRYALAAGITDPVVCYQGAVVADPVTGEFLRHVPMPEPEAREVIAAVEALGYTILVYVDDELYVAHETPESDAYAGFQHLVVASGRRPARLAAEGADEARRRRRPARARRPRDRDEGALRRRGCTSRSPSPTSSSSRARRCTRAPGSTSPPPALGFSREESVAFGDGENDVELLEWAGYGVAVANAHPRVLAIADFVCPSVDEEGVAQVIEAYSRPRTCSATLRLSGVIDLKAARAHPDVVRAALARKGGEELFDELIARRRARGGSCRRRSTTSAPARSSRASRRPSSSRS